MATSRDHKNVKRIKREAKEIRNRENNELFNERNKSFSGLKVKKFNKNYNVKINVDGDVYVIHVSVDRNNAIYDITMDGFGRYVDAYYRYYGRPFNYELMKERFEYLFKD